MTLPSHTDAAHLAAALVGAALTGTDTFAVIRPVLREVEPERPVGDRDTLLGMTCQRLAAVLGARIDRDTLDDQAARTRAIQAVLLPEQRIGAHRALTADELDQLLAAGFTPETPDTDTDTEENGR